MGWNTIDIDWTSAETLQPTLKDNPYLILHDIGEALRERAYGAIRSPIKEFLIGDTKGRSVEFDRELTALIDLYADHTQFSGEYAGQPSIPKWAQASLESNIGISRTESIPGSVISSDWAFWAYKAINLLLYAYPSISVSPSYLKREVFFLRSWAELVAAWNSAAWQTTTAIQAAHTAMTDSRLFGESYLYRGAQILPEIVVTSAKNYKLNTYCTLTDSWQYPIHGIDGIDVFIDPDYGTTVIETLAKIFSDATGRTGNIAAGDISVGYINSITLPEPSVELQSTGWSTSASQFYFVFNYDVAGGFDFVAP